MTTWNRCAQETTSETLNKDYSGVGGKLGSLGSMCTHSYIKKKKRRDNQQGGFPGGSVVKNLPAK